MNKLGDAPIEPALLDLMNVHAPIIVYTAQPDLSHRVQIVPQVGFWSWIIDGVRAWWIGEKS